MRLAAVRQRRREHPWSLPAARLTSCQVAVSSAGRSAIGDLLDQDAEDPLVELGRRWNSRRHQREASQARLTRKSTASQRLAASLSATFPALAGDDAPLRIEVEEEVVPAFRRQPVAQSGRLGVVGARMAEEDAGQQADPSIVVGQECHTPRH